MPETGYFRGSWMRQGRTVAVQTRVRGCLDEGERKSPVSQSFHIVDGREYWHSQQSRCVGSRLFLVREPRTSQALIPANVIAFP